MTRACIVTVDATRARIFLYNDHAKPGFEIVEYKDLGNPGRRLKAGELFSESRPGLAQPGGRGIRGRGATGEPGATFDDHRDAHLDDMDTKFAKRVLETVETVLSDKNLGRLVVCAAPKMLGTLRSAGNVLERTEIEIEQVTSNLSMLTEAALHDHLAQLGLIPPRTRLAIAR